MFFFFFASLESHQSLHVMQRVIPHANTYLALLFLQDKSNLEVIVFRYIPIIVTAVAYICVFIFSAFEIIDLADQ